MKLNSKMLFLEYVLLFGNDQNDYVYQIKVTFVNEICWCDTTRNIFVPNHLPICLYFAVFRYQSVCETLKPP